MVKRLVKTEPPNTFRCERCARAAPRQKDTKTPKKRSRTKEDLQRTRPRTRRKTTRPRPLLHDCHRRCTASTSDYDHSGNAKWTGRGSGSNNTPSEIATSTSPPGRSSPPRRVLTTKHPRREPARGIAASRPRATQFGSAEQSTHPEVRSGDRGGRGDKPAMSAAVQLGNLKYFFPDTQKS